MNRTTIASIALAAALVAGYFVVNAPPAQCQWCSPILCFNDAACNKGCVCMSNSPSGGSCVSFN